MIHLRPLTVRGDRGKDFSRLGMGRPDFRQCLRRLEFDARVEFAVDDPVCHVAEVDRPAVLAVGAKLGGLLRRKVFGKPPGRERVEFGSGEIDAASGDKFAKLDHQRIDHHHVGGPGPCGDFFGRVEGDAVVFELDFVRQFELGKGFCEEIGVIRPAEEDHGFGGRRHCRQTAEEREQKSEFHRLTPPARRSSSRLRADRQCRAGCLCRRPLRGSSGPP